MNTKLDIRDVSEFQMTNKGILYYSWILFKVNYVMDKRNFSVKTVVPESPLRIENL